MSSRKREMHYYTNVVDGVEFKCSQCNYTAKGNIGMKLHAKYSHGYDFHSSNIKDYCTICKKYFPKHKIKSHVISHKK